MDLNRRVNFKQFAKGMALVCTAALAALWAASLVPELKARLSGKGANAPLIKEARRLDLTYESVLTDPARALGKPAIWCLRKIKPQSAPDTWPGPGGAAVPTPAQNFTESLYDGEEGKSVYLDNPGKVYDISGSSHETCRNTLITVSKVTVLDLGGTRGVRLEASFIDYP